MTVQELRKQLEGLDGDLGVLVRVFVVERDNGHEEREVGDPSISLAVEVDAR